MDFLLQSSPSAFRCSCFSDLRTHRQPRHVLGSWHRFSGSGPRQSSTRNLERAAYSESVDSGLPVFQEDTRKYTAAGWLAAFSIVTLAGILFYRFSEQRKRERLVQEAQDEFVRGEKPEGEEFESVLASVRQVVTFQRAVQSMRSGDSARAMVELYRVLEENAICRNSLNTSSFSQEELEDVYRLHLHNSELPLKYATLLHLRQLLKLSDPQAESLEAELKGSAYEFSI